MLKSRKTTRRLIDRRVLNALKKCGITPESYQDRFSDFGRKLSDYSRIVNFLKKRMKNLNGKKILHIGASTGILIRHLDEAHHTQGISMDSAQLASSISKEIGNPRTVQGRAQELPFRKNSLDCIVSNHFLYANYIPIRAQENTILEEANKTLKKGGYLIIENAEFFPATAILNAYGFRLVAKSKKSESKFFVVKKEKDFDDLARKRLPFS